MIKHKFSALRKRAKIKILRILRPKAKRFKFPSRVGESEKIAIETFLIVLKDKDSDLYFDPITQECFLRSGDSSIYLFLEASNLKIVNTIFGYDIPLGNMSERYLHEKFKFELEKRHKKFKNEALQKVQHSLRATYDKLNNVKIQ